MEELKKEPLLHVEDLRVHYELEDEIVEAVNDVSFTLEKGETLGLVGETGAGKTTLALSIMGLIPNPPGRVITGGIYLNGEDLLQKPEAEMR